MICTGLYEVETIENGEIVQYWSGKNAINESFIGGLFYHMFGVGAENTGLTTTDASRYVNIEQAYFCKLALSTYDTAPTAAMDNTWSVYTNNSSYFVSDPIKDLTGSSIVDYKTVAMDTGAKKITLTLQTTFATNEATRSLAQYTWKSLLIGGSPIGGSTTKLVSCVNMGTGGVTKTQNQTLRVRYNFSIQVQ